MDFSKAKKWTIPVNGVQKEVKSVAVNGNTIWKGTWLYTIKLGNYVSSVKYKTSADSSWTAITSNTTVEVDSGLTLSIQAQDYSSEPTTNQYHYQMTNYNFNINRTEDNDGEEVTVYRTATAVINTYTLNGYCTNGTVTFYSSNSFNTQITTANYGTVVYYRCVGDEGYGDITGSLTVNENDFSLNTNSYVASVNIDAMIRLSYVMTFAKAGSNYGSWQNSSLTMYYGDTLSRSNNTVTCRTWNDNTVRWTNTFTNDSAPEWNYYVEYNNITSFVSSAQTITATTSRSRKSYIITFNGDGYCSWSSSTLTGYYGDIISRSGKTVSIYKWDATSTLRSSTTLTVESETEYNYSTTYSTITSPITSGQTINASTTKGRKTFTVTLQNGSYGSWSSNSITAYYNDEIILSGNTVTVYKWDATTTARASSTYTLSGDTSQYDYSNSYSTSTTITTRKKITENIQVSSVDTRTTKTYTITLSSTYGYWTNSSGSTITSIPNIYYGTACSVSSNKLTVGQSVYTFNANATTAQYSYSFSSITGTPSTITGNVTITGTATRTLRSYTVSFACTDGSWSKTSIANVLYGTTWSTSGTTVTLSSSYGSSAYTAGSSTGYSALASVNPGSGTVTGNTTINGVTSYSRITWNMAVTMSNYVTSWRYKIDSGSWVSKTSSYTITGIDYGSLVTIEGTGKESATGYSYGGYVGTGTFSYGSAHSTTLSCTRTRLTWSLSITKGNNMAAVTYKKNSEAAVAVTGTTNLTLDYSDKVVVSGTAQSEAPYNYGSVNGTGTFTYSSSAQSTTVSCSKSVKSYTLTPSVSGGSYGNWSITRTPNSSYGAPAAETWTNPTTAKTIYYGDTITASSSAAGTRYGSYNYADSDFTVATGSWNGGDAVTASITLTAKNSAPAYLYRKNGNEWIQLQSNWSNQSGYNNSYTDTGLSFDTTYTYHVAGYKSRSYWTRSASSSNYTGTSSVTGNITASFTFSENSAQTESTWTGASPSTVAIATGSRNKYTITWKYLTAYDTWTTTTEDYYWGETPSRALPGTVTSGSYRRLQPSWNDLSAVTRARTITSNYETQFYITVNTATGSSVTANGSGWYSAGTINTTTWGISDSRYYTFNSNQTTYTSSSSIQWTANEPKTISAPSVYTRLYRVVFVAIYNESAFETKYGYYEYGEQINAWEVYDDPYYYNAQYGYEVGYTQPIIVTTNDQSCTVEYDERFTRFYDITFRAVYDGSVIASQVKSLPYGNTASSLTYYGYSYDPGYDASYVYSNGSPQSGIVMGPATYSTTYSTRSTAYCSYNLSGYGTNGSVVRGSDGNLTLRGSRLWSSSNEYIWYMATSIDVRYSPGYTATFAFDSKQVSATPSITYETFILPGTSFSTSYEWWSGTAKCTISHTSIPSGGRITKSVTYRLYDKANNLTSSSCTVAASSSGTASINGYVSREAYDIELQVLVNGRYQPFKKTNTVYGQGTHWTGNIS